MKEAIIKTKSQPTEWENVFVIDISENGLINKKLQTQGNREAAYKETGNDKQLPNKRKLEWLYDY